jgi:2-keto-4-pentenoate hydratase/2-oxohepta-3-ene-1,7-dioic acid hydratase in catechol pathway
MKLLSYRGEEGPRIAAYVEGGYVDLSRVDPAIPTSMRALLEQGPEGLRRVEKAVAAGKPFKKAEPLPFLAPVPDPQKVICVGLNYADHAKESGAAIPTEPVIFCKFATAVSAHLQPIALPSVSKCVDYEAELVVVIGRGGRCIPRERAVEHVAGYTCGHDVSARDWQIHKPGGQWLLGKSFDTFAPFGPFLTTADEIADPNNLAIALRLNGEVMQQSSTAQFIFKVDELIAYISQVCTLAPGDVIFTGTPPGVGFARKPPVYLKPGDVCEVEIENLGVLRNPVIAGS